MGVEKSIQALKSLDTLYPQDGENSIIQQLALQLTDPKPWDLSETNLSAYKALKSPYNNWKEASRRIMVAGQKIILWKFQDMK